MIQCREDPRNDGSLVWFVRWRSVGMWMIRRRLPDGFGITETDSFGVAFWLPNDGLDRGEAA